MKDRAGRRSRGIAWVAGCACIAVSCTGKGSPVKAARASDCADLRFENRLYDEWRVVARPAIFVELGDATYPGCNDATKCSGGDLAGLAATDAWAFSGVDPAKAVVGKRQCSERYAVFVRRGVDPATLTPSG